VNERTKRRIKYYGAVHGQEEIDAVVEVLSGPPRKLLVGENVERFEKRVANAFGKRFGVMVNAGTSGLYVAIELLGLAPGDEIITTALTFSTDVAAMVRSRLVPVFIDVESDTFNADVNAIEAAIGPRTKAILLPNLIGNAPDWDAVRAVANRYDLICIEDSCDAFAPILRGTPTSARADLTVTSFSMSHIITCAGSGGMVLLDDPALRDRALLLRRWGRSSEIEMFGSRKGMGDGRFFTELDGMVYDSLFMFEDIGWNFEPSELGAAFGLQQLLRLDGFLAARQRIFDRLHRFFATRTEVIAPRQLDGLTTGWQCFPFIIAPDAPFTRAALQRFMETNGIDTRMVWTGNILRQPGFRSIEHRVAPSGLANTDRVMDAGLITPLNPALTDDDCDYIIATVAEFLQQAVPST